MNDCENRFTGDAMDGFGFAIQLTIQHSMAFELCVYVEFDKSNKILMSMMFISSNSFSSLRSISIAERNSFGLVFCFDIEICANCLSSFSSLVIE